MIHYRNTVSFRVRVYRYPPLTPTTTVEPNCPVNSNDYDLEAIGQLVKAALQSVIDMGAGIDVGFDQSVLPHPSLENGWFVQWDSRYALILGVSIDDDGILHIGAKTSGANPSHPTIHAAAALATANLADGIAKYLNNCKIPPADID